jgi:DNA polymerase-1
LNAQIQGSAADMSKLAMIKIDADQRLKDLKCRLLLMVHDEVICEARAENAKKASEYIVEDMLSVASHLITPFAADVEITDCWYGKDIDFEEEDK